MDDAGIVIFRNGDIIPFGKVVYIDDPEYLDKPGHSECFVNEILPSFNFKLEEYTYDENEMIYKNATSTLVWEGLIILLNNQTLSTDRNALFGYLPGVLTEEQLLSIKELVESKRFDCFEQRLYEYVDKYDEPNEYSSLNNYYATKKSKRR